MDHLINHLLQPFFVTNCDTVESFNNLDMTVFHFYNPFLNLFNISSLVEQLFLRQVLVSQFYHQLT